MGEVTIIEAVRGGGCLIEKVFYHVFFEKYGKILG
jgi:hypothetical protein